MASSVCAGQKLPVVSRFKAHKGGKMQEHTRRIWMTIVGVLVCGFSVGMFNFSVLGLDPFQVFVHGVFEILPEGAPGFGTVYAAINLLMLIVIFLADSNC